MSDQAWDCEAYGPDLPKDLASCFFEKVRHCDSLAECSARLESERQRMFQRINELAAAGDPDFAFLEGEFTNPEQLLGGDASEEPDR
jgi:hypothetical protein